MSFGAKIKISELKDQQNVRYRLGFMGVREPIWMPWQEGRIHVKRADKYVESKGLGIPKGAILKITTADEFWTAYNQTNLKHGTFIHEDNLMQIEGLKLQ